MRAPLVSVICLCYNHARFVEEAIRSVLNQTYSNVELIVVDDHSTDNSVEIIHGTLGNRPVEFIALDTNRGNCTAFNIGLHKAKGDYIIDLAADDILLPQRIEKGVEIFESLGGDVGVQFGDAELIDETGQRLGYHSDRFPHATIPQGYIYKEVLSSYFIISPSMMISKKVLDWLGGYDESLAYEDFDFWVRSSRCFKYCYSREPLIKRRMVSTSLGEKQYRSGSSQLRSTLMVCEKALELNETRDEHIALKKRILYEMRMAFLLGELRVGWSYMKLWRRIP